MMNKEERLTVEEQLEEIKDCGSKFTGSQYYCLYKYDIERIIPYIEDLQQRIDKAIRLIEEHNKNAGKLYYKYNNKYLLSEIKEDLLEILGGKE